MVCMWGGGGGGGGGEGGGGGWTDRPGTNDTQTNKTKTHNSSTRWILPFPTKFEMFGSYKHEGSTDLLSVISLMGIIFQKEVIEE